MTQGKGGTRAFAVGLAAALAVTALVFREALHAGLAGDEFAVLAVLVRPKSWLEILGRAPANFYHYIPVAFAFWKAEDAVFGLSPAAAHAVAVALYIVAVVLAAFTFRRLLGAGLAAALAAALFASFYANYEPVVFLSTAYYTLSLCFFLAAVLLYPRGPDRVGPVRHGGFLLFAALALFTFEQAIVFLPLIVLLEYDEGGVAGVRSRWRRFVAPAALVAVYLVLWFAGRGATGLTSPPSLVGVTKKALIALAYLSSFNVAAALEGYFRGPFAVRVVVTLLLAAVWVGLLVRGSRRVRLLALWALLALAPTLMMQGQKPRYLMFSAVPVTALWALALVRLEARVRATSRWARARPAGTLAVLVAVALVGSGAAFQADRLREWVRAGAVMDAFRRASTEALSESRFPATVAVVDAPAMSGPYDDVRWPAYIFQSAFNEGSIFRLTPPYRVPEETLLLRTGPVDPARPVVAEDSVDDAGIRSLLARGGMVFRFRPDLRLEVLTPPK